MTSEQGPPYRLPPSSSSPLPAPTPQTDQRILKFKCKLLPFPLQVTVRLLLENNRTLSPSSRPSFQITKPETRLFYSFPNSTACGSVPCTLVQTHRPTTPKISAHERENVSGSFLPPEPNVTMCWSVSGPDSGEFYYDL